MLAVNKPIIKPITNNYRRKQIQCISSYKPDKNKIIHKILKTKNNIQLIKDKITLINNNRGVPIEYLMLVHILLLFL